MGIQKRQSDAGVSVTVCDGWEDFHEAVAIDEIGSLDRIWRGHARLDWQLASVLEREASMPGYLAPGSAREQLEFRQETSLRAFKRNVRALPSVTEDPTPDTEGWEALARQHGLDSNLLDWTRSPYFAAFFAFAALVEEPGWMKEDKRIAVWGLTVDSPLRSLSGLTVLDDALPGNMRLHAQQGLFTKLQAPDHFDLESFLVSQGMGEKLMRVELPGLEAWNALVNLQRMGISYTRLFPDFDGAAKDANIGDRHTLFATFVRMWKGESP